MIISATGHRPNKLYGYNLHHPGWRFLGRQMRERLEELEPSTCISGMALGVDTVFALVTLQLGIPLECAIPCRGQERLWRPESQRLYHSILERAHRVTLVTNAEYSAELMQKRNEYMVNRCHLLLAAWDGSAGGTANCIRYAQKTGREIIFLEIPNRI